MSEWIEYTGSDEQIAEMLNNEEGFICKNKKNFISHALEIKYGALKSKINRRMLCELMDIRNYLKNEETTHYILCQPHPYADLIKIWADTGCPVWIKFLEQYEIDFLGFELVDYLQSGTVFKTSLPNWNIPGAEYSLTPFGD